MIARLALVAALLSAQSAGAQDVGGLYAVQGTNFNGSSYGGQAEIVLTSDVTCAITWTTGSTTSSGICMRSDEVFSAAYQMGAAVGLAIYRIRNDGVLDGSWTIAGQNGVGYEVLVPQ